MNQLKAMSSSQTEFHRKALTEPCVIVSHHTALSDQVETITKDAGFASAQIE